MRYWSEGLGRRELVIDLEKSKLTRKPNFLELSGVVDSPAPWAYEIEVEFDDWKAILETAAKPETGTFLVQRASWGVLLRIAAGLSKFIIILAFFRIRRLVGLDRCQAATPIADEPPAPGPASENVGR